MKLKFLFILCVLTISCNMDKKKSEPLTTDEMMSDYAVLTVAEIEYGKDGYRATLTNDTGSLYTCIISKVHLEDEYKSLKVGNKVKIIGDYGNGEPTPIRVKRLMIMED